MTLAKFRARAEILVLAHWFNWRPGDARRRFRKKVVTRVGNRFLPLFIKAADGVPETTVEHKNDEKIFALWLQGEEQAPPIVRACFRSMRRNCPDKELVVLDAKNLFDWVDLPDFVVEKWRKGKIGAAHFSDIVRVELLYEHGGYWFDATDFVTDPIPDFVQNADFFVYLAGTSINEHTFIQNCFIRARKGSWLLAAWRAVMLDYWSKNNHALTYFQHQILFKHLVAGNARAAELFAQMPHYDQDPTHVLWYDGRSWGGGEGATGAYTPEEFARLTAGTFFQKTSYREWYSKNPPPGSNAEHLINS